MHRFLPLLVQIQGGAVIEIVVNHRPRKTGTSKYNVQNRLFRGLLDLYGVWWLKRRALRFDVIWQTESPHLAIDYTRTPAEEGES
jgi:dolichol-phosphate mannosyltransferase